MLDHLGASPEHQCDRLPWPVHAGVQSAHLLCQLFVSLASSAMRLAMSVATRRGLIRARVAARALPLASLLILLCTPTADIYADAQPQVPAALSPWVGWVLHGEDRRACPLGWAGAAEGVCAWPGPLRLELDDGGGRFEQVWTLAADSWLPLPGGTGQWPQQVSANGAPVAVIEREGRPMARLAAGEVALRGRFAWPQRPDVLQVPSEIALLSLSLNGAAIAQPRLDAKGGLWLGAERRPSTATGARCAVARGDAAHRGFGPPARADAPAA